MDANDPEEFLPDDIIVPEGRDRLGLAHQMRVDISIAISLAPAWLRRALADRNPIKARGARVEMVERIAVALEPVSYTHLRAPRDKRQSRMPSSA